MVMLMMMVMFVFEATAAAEQEEGGAACHHHPVLCLWNAMQVNSGTVIRVLSPAKQNTAFLPGNYLWDEMKGGPPSPALPSLLNHFHVLPFRPEDL